MAQAIGLPARCVELNGDSPLAAEAALPGVVVVPNLEFSKESGIDEASVAGMVVKEVRSPPLSYNFARHTHKQSGYRHPFAPCRNSCPPRCRRVDSLGFLDFYVERSTCK